ncbi:MAG: hypothetical protein PQJ59_16355 [Spirochaetales bacterium]|nr:hypothetical protein [Spirochaetales bacterium]
MFHKRAYGLNIDSEIDIEAFLDRPSESTAQITILRGNISVPRKPFFLNKRKIIAHPNGVLMYWRGIGYFLVEEGRRITVMTNKRHHRPGIVQNILLGPCMGVILIQRKEHHLFHSAVVAKRDGRGAVAILGRGGDGKSTTATALCNSGYSLVCDDLLVLNKDTTPYMVQSGFPGMKLWLTSAAALVEKGEDLPMIGKKGELEKRFRKMEDNFIEESLPLGPVFILSYDERLTEPRAQRLSETEALQEMLGHWYGALFKQELLPILGTDRQFRECSEFVKKTQIYRLTRPYDMDKLQDSVDLIDKIRCDSASYEH